MKRGGEGHQQEQRLAGPSFGEGGERGWARWCRGKSGGGVAGDISTFGTIKIGIMCTNKNRGEGWGRESQALMQVDSGTLRR